jgi:hypothetical protein
MKTRVAAVTLLALLVAGCQRRPAPGEDPSASTTRAVGSAEPSIAAPHPTPAASAAPSASTAELTRPPLPAPERAPALPSALVAKPPRPPTAVNAGFRGPVDASRDAEWIARLASAPITEIVRNPGGATLTMRVRFADGNRAVFKPDQTHSASNFRSEIAAYHVDRVMGFGRTAVVVGRNVGFGHLLDHLEHSGADPAYIERFKSEVKSKNGIVPGAMIAWHSGKLANAEPPHGWPSEPADAGTASPERQLEWSDMTVFDFLIDNTDRWSGGNVLSLGSGGPLIFLDNAAGFSSYRASRGETSESRLKLLCRFRRATRDSLVAVGPAAEPEHRLGAVLRRSLALDPLAPVLGERHFSAIDERVKKLIDHIDGCIDELGEKVVLAP